VVEPQATNLDASVVGEEEYWLGTGPPWTSGAEPAL